MNINKRLYEGLHWPAKGCISMHESTLTTVVVKRTILFFKCPLCSGKATVAKNKSGSDAVTIFFNKQKPFFMGTIGKGILGGFSGKVGTVIGGTWKGIDYMRSKSNKRKFEPSEKQMEQQLRFAITMFFLQPVASLFETTFRSFAVKMTGMNSAFSYTINNAITGKYPNFAIDYQLALMSRGELPNALAPAVTSGVNSILTFSWTNNSGAGSARATDQAIFVVYCPDLRQAIYTLTGGARSSITGDLNVLPFSGFAVQTYLAFISQNGKLVATSLFTGEVTVS